MRLRAGIPALALAAACALAPRPVPSRLALVPAPAGVYRLGSSAEERALGVELSPPGVRAQGWYDAWERPPHEVALPRFEIERFPVTQRAYGEFVRATGHRAPFIEREGYQEQGFLVHPYAEVVPYLWQVSRPPLGLEDHPVVLASRDDAAAYCVWRGLRLPTEEEWEAACRGKAGRRFPWGDTWVAGAAQAEASSTAPVGAHPQGCTPRGVCDLAGNVFEWTASTTSDGHAVLRGCSWDDAPGTCRCAFRHMRPAASRHILIGFRCARNAKSETRAD